MSEISHVMLLYDDLRLRIDADFFRAINQTTGMQHLGVECF